MSINKSKETFPLADKEQIGKICEQFEQGWQTGRERRMESFLDEVTRPLRRSLMRELLIIELHYRRQAAGEDYDIKQLVQDHPELMPDIADEYRQLEGREDVTVVASDAGLHISQDPSKTPEYASSGTGSRGLKIRCPHCSNAMELLADTPYESITCRTCGSAFSLIDREEVTRQATPLKSIGRFELISRIGLGGFGTVWKARDTELDRIVAVKIPRKGQLAPSETEQFFREARSAAQLRHPNIVPVHEIGRDADTIFIVSDLIRGVSLSDFMTSGPVAGKEVARQLSAIADALEHAHRNGVIHRDVKPSNILLDDDGNPYLLDFGLAKREVGEITITAAGQVLGTPAYMSPEQAEGDHQWIDCRTDIYSLGVVIFRMLTGELPFRGNAQMQIQKRQKDAPPDPRSLNRNISQDLSTICLKCMERDPNRRYSTAKEVGEELRRFLLGEPIHSRPISRIQRAVRWARRNPMVATTLGLAVFLAIAGPLTAVWFQQQRKRLENLVVEKNNLIEQASVEKQEDAQRITHLQERVDLWEGRANPWEFWPPNIDRPPHHAALESVSDEVSAALKAQLTKGNLNAPKRASAHITLALLADWLQQNRNAYLHYQSANKVLSTLVEADPENSRYLLALAECHLQMSRITKDDLEASKLHADKAREILEHLNNKPMVDPKIRVFWMDAELRGAVSSGYDDASEKLDQAEKLSRMLQRELPSNPEELYQFVCYLLHRDPVLIERAETTRSE